MQQCLRVALGAVLHLVYCGGFRHEPKTAAHRRGDHQRREHGMTSTNQCLRASFVLAAGLLLGGLLVGGCGGEASDSDDLDDVKLESSSEDLVSNPLTPVLTCMDKVATNTYKAHFGYNNTSARSVQVPIGALNFFVPLPKGQGQPTSFEPGNHPDVFTVNFSTRDGWDRLAWWLSGRRALATRTTPICAPPPPQCTANSDCDDADPCTTNTCTSGRCVTAPAPARAACGHAGLCNGSGLCVQCLIGNDCDDAKACTTDLCMSGLCSHGSTPAGSSCGHAGVCDGAGSCQPPACLLDSDCDDGDTCTSDVCASGACNHPPAPARTACGHAGLCDGAGLCLQCLTGTDCDDAKVCTTDLCVSGLCSHGSTPAGSDCGHSGHCDGAGLCQP
jgi:hypothetical protein